MPMLRPQPSYANGFARSPGESAHPDRWKGHVGIWSPAVGVQGGVLFDFFGHGNNGTLIDMNLSTDWIVDQNGIALQHDGTDGRVSIDSSPDFKILGDAACIQRVLLRSINGILFAVEGSSGETEADNAIFFLDVLGTTNARDLRYIHEYGNGTNELNTFNTSLNDNQWYVIIVSRDSVAKVVSLYIDGILFGTFPYTNQPTLSVSSVPIEIGARADSSSAGNIKFDYFSYLSRTIGADEALRISYDVLAPFELKRRPVAFVPAAPVGAIPYPNPRYALAGGMQPLGGGIS